MRQAQCTHKCSCGGPGSNVSAKSRPEEVQLTTSSDRTWQGLISWRRHAAPRVIDIDEILLLPSVPFDHRILQLGIQHSSAQGKLCIRLRCKRVAIAVPTRPTAISKACLRQPMANPLIFRVLRLIRSRRYVPIVLTGSRSQPGAYELTIGRAVSAHSPQPATLS